MDRLLLSVPIGIVLLLAPSVAQAGPCSAGIADFEMAVRQSGAEGRASEPLQSQFSATMARAIRLDGQGDRVSCIGALNAARRTYIAMH
jgi:hypothetical protein